MMLVWLGRKEGNIVCLDVKNMEQESVSEVWLPHLGFMGGVGSKKSNVASSIYLCSCEIVGMRFLL